MEKNELSKEMKEQSFSSLEKIVKNSKNYTKEEFLAAKWELEKRGHFNLEYENPENAAEYIEIIEGFPEKPIEVTKQQSINRSLISLALFVGAFYMIFKWDFKYVLVLAGVIFIHELGHFLAMRIFKYNDLGIFFVPLIGAFATGRKDTVSQKQNVIILLAGPLPGVIIGSILYFYGLREANEFIIRTSNIFIFLNLFNLIPVMPLDGGRVIKSMFFDNNEIINTIFLVLSIIILVSYSFYAKSYSLLIVPFFLITQLNTQSQVKKVKQGVADKSINTNRSFEELTDEEYWLIRDEIGTHMKYYNRFITPKRYVVADSEQKIIKQVKDIVQKKPTKDLKIFGKIMITFLWLMTFVVPFVLILFYYIILGIKL